MKTRGFSYELFKAVYWVCQSIVLSVLMYFFMCRLLTKLFGWDYHYGRFETALMYIFLADVVFLLIFCIVSLFSVKSYAASIIKFDKKRSNIERIDLDESGVAVYYLVGKEVRCHALLFNSYGIKTTFIKDLEVPCFYLKRGVVKRVELPFVDQPAIIWHEYETEEQ